MRRPRDICLRWTWNIRLRRSQRQLRGLAQHVAFLIRERPFKPIRLKDAFALIGRHRAQITDGCFHHLLTLLRKLLPLGCELSCLRLLLGRQVLPGFDPVETALLFLGRQVVEIVQAVHEPLLLLRRQLAKLRIALQSLLLV